MTQDNKTDKVIGMLDMLPEIVLGNCLNCGTHFDNEENNGGYTSCNINKQGETTDCNKCKELR